MPTAMTASALRREIEDDTLIYILIISHILIALFFGLLFDRLDTIRILNYFGMWFQTLVIVLPSIGVVSFGIYLSFVRPNSPFEVSRALLRKHVDTRVIAGLGLSAALMASMGAFTSLKNMMATFAGFGWDLALAKADVMIHGADPWRLLPETLWSAPVLRVIEINYSLVWMIYVLGVASAVAMFVHDRRFRMRFMVCYMAVWVGLGNGMAALFLSAGPAFFKEVTGDGERFRELIERLSVTGDAGHSASGYQQLLWMFHQNQDVAAGSGISAFPSIHVAMVTLYCLFAYELNHRVGHLALAYLVVTQVSSVLLGWHYAVDGYASMGAVAVIYFAVKAAMADRPAGAAIFARPQGLETR